MTSRRNTSSQGGDTKAGKIHLDVFINKLLLLLLLLLGISTKHKPHLSKNKLFGKLLHAKVRINMYMYITCVYIYMYITCVYIYMYITCVYIYMYITCLYVHVYNMCLYVHVHNMCLYVHVYIGSNRR